MLRLIVFVSLLGVATSYSQYLQVDLSGTLPIILSAPHCGWLKPDDIPDRQYGCYDAMHDTCTYTHHCTQPRSEENCPIITYRDLKTDEVAEILYDKLTEMLGASPKLIFSKLHRDKLDPNREKEEAACGNPQAEAVYDDYHGAIRDARDAIPGRGILFDIHGHSSTETWVMLGYAIRGTALNELPDRQLEDLANTSSIRYLASQSHSSFADLVRGEGVSFGAMMTAEGLEAVPSPVNPSPGSATFYSGGYIAREHGSRKGGKIDAIQVEIHRVNRTPKSNRVQFSEALARAIVKYYRTHYEMKSFSNGAEGICSSSGITVKYVTLTLLVLFFYQV